MVRSPARSLVAAADWVENRLLLIEEFLPPGDYELELTALGPETLCSRMIASIDFSCRCQQVAIHNHL